MSISLAARRPEIPEPTVEVPRASPRRAVAQGLWPSHLRLWQVDGGRGNRKGSADDQCPSPSLGWTGREGKAGGRGPQRPLRQLKSFVRLAQVVCVNI